MVNQSIRKLRRTLALTVLLGLLATACGTATTETTDAAAAPAEATESEAAQAAASPLSGQFGTIDGETVNLADYEGQDVVLWFWAPW